MSKRSLIPIITTILLTVAISTATAHAQPITGKVIGISDGDMKGLFNRQSKKVKGINHFSYLVYQLQFGLPPPAA